MLYIRLNLWLVASCHAVTESGQPCFVTMTHHLDCISRDRLTCTNITGTYKPKVEFITTDVEDHGDNDEWCSRDDQLKWPLCGVAIFKLVDQEGDKDHVIQDVESPISWPIEFSRRVVMHSGRSCHRWGMNEFLPLAELATPKAFEE